MRLKKKSILKRVISFFISYSLIFNNLLYASLPIAASGNNKEAKVYNLEKEDEEIETNRNSSINLPRTSVDSEEFKYILSFIRENIMINKIINSEKFRKRFYNASNLKLEELTKLLEKSAKAIITQESNKTKEETKVRVLLYNEDNDVRGYSFNPSSNLETRTIGINIKNHNMTDSADLVETIFHESYDEKKHTDNEISAIRFGRYARRLWDTVVRVNNFTYLENSSNFTKINISDPRIEDATKETKKIYKKIKTLGYKAGIFNEAKIMGRYLDGKAAEEACKMLPKQCVPGSDPKQYRFVHYEIFFEDEEGGHIGFHGDGQIRPDGEANIGKYEYTIKKDLDDKILRKAIELAKNEGIEKYGAFKHNCQHFIKDDVMPRYDHQKMVTEAEVKFGDKIGGIKDEIKNELGTGLGIRSEVGLGNRPAGIGNGLGGIGGGIGGIGGGLGNGIGNGLGGIGGIGNGLGNGPGGIGGGLGNGIGGIGNGLGGIGGGIGGIGGGLGNGIGNGLGGIGGIGNGLGNGPGGIGGGLGGIGNRPAGEFGGLGNGPGGVRGELGAGLGAMLDAGLGPGGRLGGRQGGIGNNNRPGGLGGGGFGNGAGGFGGGFGRF